MKNLYFLLLLVTLCSQAFAGNGVERGSIKINDNGAVIPEISEYLQKSLLKCGLKKGHNTFEIAGIDQRRDRVDQGIIDIYYQIEFNHFDQSGLLVNHLTIELLDSDFHNWRHYEEKLSLEILNDKNQLCNSN